MASSSRCCVGLSVSILPRRPPAICMSAITSSSGESNSSSWARAGTASQTSAAAASAKVRTSLVFAGSQKARDRRLEYSDGMFAPLVFGF